MEYRYRCAKCNWDGLETDIKEHKKLSGKPFPVCPKCGEHKEKVNSGSLSYNKSVLTGYACCADVYKEFGWKCIKRPHSGDHQDEYGNTWLGNRHLFATDKQQKE